VAPCHGLLLFNSIPVDKSKSGITVKELGQALILKSINWRFGILSRD
jgi:hypothetical protein